MGLRSTYRRCRFWQKNLLMKLILILPGMKTSKIVAFGAQKTRTHWKSDAPKTNHCLVRILVQRHNWVIFLRNIMLQSMTVIIIFLTSAYFVNSSCLIWQIIWLCIRFAKWASDRLTEEKKIIFSDEAHFDLGGYVNKQNCRIWGTE